MDMKVNRYAKDLVECIAIGGGCVSGLLWGHRNGRTMMSRRTVWPAEGTPLHVAQDSLGFWSAQGKIGTEEAQVIFGGGA